MQIGVLGLGRFGRFWAELLLQQADAVYAWNRTPRELPHGVQPLTDDIYERLDIVFLCTSIASVRDIARYIAPRLHPHTIVADTCSVKMQPVADLIAELPRENPILGTHPMFGPDSAGNGVEGLPLVLSPVRLEPEAMTAVQNFFMEYRMNILHMSPEEHDREAAYTQGITHFIGRVLKDLELRPSPIATLGYTRLLQVMEQTCNDPWSLFMDLQQRNPYTADMRSKIKQSLDKFLFLLEND
ncbi:MAG: prephenate dehydrogenase/arogenate dehydrogenase family protein [Spirochaeta sp.]